MKTILYSACLVALGLSDQFAAEILLKQIPNGNYFSEATNAVHTSDPYTWSPGFRTASAGGSAYVVGWTDGASGHPDGFITRIDPAGSIVWTETASSIFNDPGSYFRINDIEALDDRIYIAGTRTRPTGGQWAFVAQLSLRGTLLRHSLIEGVNGDANATALAIGSSNNQTLVTVVGNATGTKLVVRQPDGVTAFDSANLTLRARDAFVTTFDDQLSATWATTLSNDDTGTYGTTATAVTADNTGAIFVALVTDTNNNGVNEPTAKVLTQNFERKVAYVDSSGQEMVREIGASSGALNNDYDPHGGSLSVVYRITPQRSASRNDITHYFQPIKLEGGENAADSRVSDLVYADGALFATGEFKQWLRPQSTTHNAGGEEDRIDSQSNSSDIWVARLSANDLSHSAWRVYNSSKHDLAASLAIGSDQSIYIAGVAGGTLNTRTFQDGAGTSIGTTVGSNSSKAHLFWQKLSSTDLAPAANWHIAPVEDGTITPPDTQRVAGIGVVGDTVVISGSWKGGDLTLGPDVARRKTLTHSGSSDYGFVAFLKDSGGFLEQVRITINSEYGQPKPHGGPSDEPDRAVGTVAAGQTIKASVPAEIFEDALGNGIDPEDETAIRERAVTRRICTGYQFRNSTVNGTANTVTFVAGSDTELTFLWRTEHAVEIDSDLSGIDGLTSTAAGNPDPAVQKHWVKENEPFTAFIDGAETDPSEPGVRWRSTGYVAHGSVAEAAGVSSGAFVAWDDHQARQQTPKVTVGSPGSITWRWQKELSLRTSVNSSVATSAPMLVTDQVKPDAVNKSGNTVEYTFNGMGVGITSLDIWAEQHALPYQFKISRKVDGSWEQVHEQSNTFVLSSPTTISIPNNGQYASQWKVEALRSTWVFFDFEYRAIDIDGADVRAITIDPNNPPSRNDSRVISGSGEHWFSSGSTLFSWSSATVSSGISTLSLNGYTGGQGAVIPFSGKGVRFKEIVLDEPSTIVWDYARAIYPETVIIGMPVTFSGVTGDDRGRFDQTKAPAGGTVLLGPSGSGWENMQAWDKKAEKLYALQPGKFTLEFENTLAPDDAAQNVIIEVEAVLPDTPHYTHVLEAPPVNLDTSTEDNRAFVRIAYTDSEGQVSEGQFSAREEGRSVLLFSERNNGSATANLDKESLVVRVVNSLHWETSAGATRVPTIIGEAITSSYHQGEAVGHNGFVIQDRAPVNADIYNPITQTGSIIPVNGRPARVMNQTNTHTGEIIEFTGPNDLLLDPARAVIAVNMYGENSLDVNGVTFLGDREDGSVTSNGVTVTTDAGYFADDYSAAPNFSGGPADSAANLGEIMRDIRWEYGSNKFEVTVSGLLPGGVYHLQLLTNESSPWDRRYDVVVNDRLVVDNFTSHGDSARHAWNASNSFAYAGEFIASPSGEIVIKLGANFGGYGPINGTDSNPLLQAVVVHHAESASPDHEFGVAWYELKEGIRWPHKAIGYDPVWPTNPDRIVIASRLGSEGLNRSYVDPAGGINVANPDTASYTSFNPGPHASWIPPDSATGEHVNYHQVGVVPLSNGNPFFAYTWGWSADVYLYDGGFNPGDPQENLVNESAIKTDPNVWKAIGGGIRFREYTVVLSQPSPISAFGWLNVEANQGAGIYVYQPEFDSPPLADPVIYQQADRGRMGYNPNEEHAIIAPSFLEAARPAAFALRQDLNHATMDGQHTSHPFVLVQYKDRTNPANPVDRMKVYALAEEDVDTYDLRLPVHNRRYTYFYEGEAGQRLLPPHPLDTVLGGSPIPEETEGENIDDRISYYEDKNLMPWVVSGDTDAAEDIRAAWYYPLRADFWHPTKQFGEAVSVGELTEARPRNIWYNTVWPEDLAVLKAGETLTFAGGEYATDNNTFTPRPQGLPQAVAWQSGKLVFDEANASLTSSVMGSNYLARVFPALESREADLALTAVPDELTPASGNVIVDGLLWRFKQLPASLQERVYYNTSNQKLGVRGLLNGRILGDGDLLAAPGAQTILEPNVLTAEDEALIRGLSSSVDWINAVSAIASLSRNPNAAAVTGSLGIGLEPADGGGAMPANSFGPGLVVVTNPDLQDPSTVGTLPEGYLTISENDHEDLGDAPVAMHVIRVTREKYRGSVAVMKPSNVFDEKVSLRHTADFGGDVSELKFQWYLREEDGRDLNPPGVILPTAGTPTGSDWTLFQEGLGLSEIQLAGSGPRLITDNLVFCRYGYGSNPTEWSAWGGAANSREPDLDSPSKETDAAYVAQLVPGWVKRVTEAVNLFDARFDDFANNDAPATYTSALQQAGQRWEGPVAFNPNKDAIENVGLIALYQTVLDRAEDFTIASAPGTDGVNTALLNAANRIAGLYTLLGNEAYADALDPMIGYNTVGGEFGSLAPAIHAFQNQTPNLLEEELTLLRGRGEVGARPGYNRFLWNFTNGPGEAAYVLNYGIHDLTNDGFLDDEDARRLYPQGHGDAWGHYTMALKGYYDLATTENFAWSPRSEKVTIDGIVVNVDYLDERAFAKTAAARARCGAELVDLTYRRAYTENPNGQWQGYQDTNTDRGWGVFETAQRSGMAAQFDWMLGNALLPAEDTAHTGIRKVDRSTVVELGEIAQHASKIQAKLDMADRGLNPAGLDPNVISFDIDPVLSDRTHEHAATHFEQVFDRAIAAAGNALRTFDRANEIALQLRRTETTSETLRQQTIDQDLAYRNELIELFGSPYEGMIGAGKAYPAGYKGPDLYLWMYVNQVAAGGDVLKELSPEVAKTVVVPGLRHLASDTNPFQEGGVGVTEALKETVAKYFPSDVAIPETSGETLTLDLPRQPSGYALVAPASWGDRRSPGAIQAAVQELVHSEWRLRTAIMNYESTADDFKALLRRFELKSGIAAEKIRVTAYAVDEQFDLLAGATAAFAAGSAASLAAGIADDTFDALNEALPKIVGLSNDATAPARGAIGALKASLSNILNGVASASNIAQYRLEIEAADVLVKMDQALLTEDLKAELIDMLDEIQQQIDGETPLLTAIIDSLESMRAASDRVRTVIEEGQALIEERTVFNTRVASTTTKQRYEDYTFRVFHHEALRKYRSSFDLAARYAYLAGKAYQYELNLPDNHSANAQPLLAEMLRTRSLGEWQSGEPVLGNGGLADSLAILSTNFSTLKGQLGFNNPDTEVQSFSLRTELARIGLSSRVNADWRTQLENWRVPDLWNYEYQHNGVNYGYVFRRYCRPFAPEEAGAQPALVIPFDSTITAGLNWFGNTLAGGDSAFNASNFSTKVRAVGVRFDGYNNTALSQTPQVYLVPIGDDKMFLPDSRNLASRSWRVVDQRIPSPISISTSQLSSPDWQPYTGSATGFFEEIRKFSSFRAYHDAGGWSASEMLRSGRLVGRSVWNTQWVLIVPTASLLSDPNNATSGIDTFIHGAPLPGYDQQTAGLTNRDRIGVRDVRLLFQTYSVSGN